MLSSFSARVRLSLPLALLMATAVSAVEIKQFPAAAYQIETLPRSVSALACAGSTTHAVTLQLKDRKGAWLDAAAPSIARLEGVAWSPHDPARDGAGEFEVLISTARLLKDNALAGFVTVGNSNGSLLPNTENALRRAVHMGVPVVRLARDGRVEANQADLFVAAGGLKPADAERILANCLLRFGALPPAANPARPTSAETAAIRAHLARYQEVFDLQSAALFSAQPSEFSAMVAMR